MHLVRPYAGRICLRGDTDSLTENFDRWDEQGIRMVLGMDVVANLGTNPIGANAHAIIDRPAKKWIVRSKTRCGAQTYPLRSALDYYDGARAKQCSSMRPLLFLYQAGSLVVGLASCDQENVIEQLKNGVNAMRMPVDELMSNGPTW